MHTFGTKNIFAFITAACAILFTSCAQKPVTTTRSNDAIAKLLQKTEPETVVDPNDHEASRAERLTLGDVLRLEEPNTQNLYDNSRYDFPITVNARVEGWIDYFTGRGRDHMVRYLGRSGKYIPIMKQIFKKSGLPEDLVYLALIESGFNLRAKSRAKAVGPWQFMKPTGKRYGLRVDGWVDERRDPLRSTQAAANYLKDLYLMFESWYLAASAYNAGEYKILRAIEELKTNNFWRISDTKMIRRETKDYIPKLIAAAIIAKNPDKYGFKEVVYQEPLEFEEVIIGSPIKLREVAKVADASEDDILDLNPSFVRGMIPPDGSYDVRVPVGKRVIVERTLATSGQEMEKGDVPKEHVVKSGESLQSISNKYHLKPRDLAAANNLSTRERLSPGSTLLIPSSSEKQQPVKKEPTKRTVSSVAQITPTIDGNFIIHTVKNGESLWSISEKYDVTVQNIFKWNALKRSHIVPGKKLKIKSANS